MWSRDANDERRCIGREDEGRKRVNGKKEDGWEERR